MTGKRKNQKLTKSAIQKENESDTPKVKKPEITKKNLQFPEKGSDEGETPATGVSDQLLLAAEVANQLPMLAAVNAAGQRRQDPTLSVAHQKQVERDKREKAEMDRAIENMVDRQDLIIEKLLRIQDSIKTEAANNVHYLHLQLQTIQRAYDEFDSVHNELLALLPREKRGESKQKYLNFEVLHGQLYVDVQTMIANQQKPMASEVLPQNANASGLQPRPQVVNSVPHLQVPLPTFDGKLENWYAFKSMFHTVMNRYPNESPAIKLYHLKNSLIGEASGKIDQDIINNNDYDSAWRMLEDAYEDQRLIIDTHIDALFNLPKITKENGEELRKLVESCSKHVDALKNHDLPVEGLSEMMLINIINKRLDRETRKQWESSLSRDDQPSYDELIDFLKDRSRVLQKLSSHAQPSQTQPVAKSKQQKVFVQTNKDTCPCCSGSHNIYKCESFKKLSIPERFEKVKRAGLCFNCLRAGHRTMDCKTDKQCKTCSKRHHSYLHNERVEDPKKPNDSSHPKNPAQETKIEPDSGNPVEARTVTCCTQTKMATKQIFLSTAKVLVSGSGNVTTTCRALLDCCSESNLITKKLAEKLNIKPSVIDPPIAICGLNGMTTSTNQIIQTKVSSRDGKFFAVLDFLVTPAITELPSGKIDTYSWPLPAGIELADPSFNIPDEVDMIIGAEVFYDVLRQGRLKIGSDFPVLAETTFGWVVSGPVKTVQATSRRRRICQMNTTQEDINRTLTRFWELEAGYVTNKMTAEERTVEQHFEETHCRNSEGRYVVRLPFNDLQNQLGDSYEYAKLRCSRLISSLSKNPSKQIAYTEFMNEYRQLGHMQEVSDNPDRGYFLPHHAVYKESSSTTKTRVVFDASAATTTGVSLNDTQLVGPTVQSDLITLILRFCTHQVVLTADVPKMYRQVQVHPDDRQYQRIVWLNDKGELATFELTTVTYGCSSAPYLATRSLIQLAADEGEDFPLAARAVKKDSYIDDFITGGRTAIEVVQMYEQLKEMLKRGGFGVHKFCSNSPEVLRAIPDELQEKKVDFESSELNNTIKTLGLIWNPNDDYFAFNVTSFINQGTPTKRIVLSEIGRLYDPLGFLGPVGTIAKLTMQELWRLKLDWDDELPDEQMDTWNTFRVQLQSVRRIRKKRCVIPGDAKRIELHGYCDASKRAYGACLYVRCVLGDGKINVQLLCSKSRVAPLKPVTIPRLELCAALVLAQLTRKSMEALQVNFDSVTLWSDSQIVLSWLKKSPLVLNEFVCNRVVSIIELTPNYEWRYVRSECNPADALSRGMLPEPLIENELWWGGSPELRQSRLLEEEIPAVTDENLPELRTRVFVNIVKEPAFYFGRVSRFTRLQRAWAYVWRFIDNTRAKVRNNEPLSATELSRATQTIVKLVQEEGFPDLLKDLKMERMKRNNYSGLAPFVDQDGVIRVGGRLKYSQIPYEGKHQILLPDKHHVTQILVREMHERNLHVGQNGLVSIVRQQYWPVKLKSIVKQTTNRCYVCYRNKPQQTNQFMGDLPSYRVTPSPVFSKTGIDFAGPFVLKESGRKPKFYKAYVCVFVCMSVKAVHLELCTDLRSETFLGALQRFVSRRGLPSDLFSDNGTTFVGADHELANLRKLFEDQMHTARVTDFCSAKGITWHFIPPRSPHFGGIWEAGVKSMKYLLKRVVGETRLTYEEMATFLAEAEAVLNSRPLCPLSDDPSDLEALTPSHFLIGRPGQAITEPSYSQQKINRLSRWQHVQSMREHFWNRWSTDYLHTLQTRQKWKDGVLDIKIGSLVLLRDENLSPQLWKMGRIVSLHPGKDGIVRVITVKTSSGEYRRAVAKVCLLPDVESDDPRGGV